MFYLRTGGNGSGKTLFTLQDVRKLQLETGRPVYFNIRPASDKKSPSKPYSNLKQATIDEFGWRPFRFEEWESQDVGAIFLVDECHYDLPARPASSKVPDHIARLTEHRKYGFDFFLLSPHPKMVDGFVRNLVQAPGWHQHVKRIAGAAPVSNFVQWDAVELQCEKFGSGKNAQVKTRSFPREVYNWYDSAEIHTGKLRIPKQYFIIAACAVAVPTLLYLGFSKALGWGGASAKSPSSGGSGSLSLASAGADSSAGAAKPKTASEYIDSYRPRIAGLMHTAPAYDELTRPRRVPVPSACVDMPSKGCKCYTQDATPYPVDLKMCRQLVAHGAFLAFQPEGEARPLVAASKPPAAPEAGSGGSNGLILIGGASPAAPSAPAPPPMPDPQPRVKAGSKWSFQVGG